MFDHHLIEVLLEVGNSRTSSETDVWFFLFCSDLILLYNNQYWAWLLNAM